MNKWITTAIIIIFAIGTIANGILYLQENRKLKDAQSQILDLHKNVSVLRSVFPKLGQEFPLSIGQSTLIEGEDLRLTFKEVSKDSRCPGDVICITQGEVVCLLEIENNDAVYDLELVQSGLYYDYSEKTSGSYKYKFIVKPYPEANFSIANYEYRLLLTVSR